MGSGPSFTKSPPRNVDPFRIRHPKFPGRLRSHVCIVYDGFEDAVGMATYSLLSLCRP